MRWPTRSLGCGVHWRRAGQPSDSWRTRVVAPRWATARLVELGEPVSRIAGRVGVPAAARPMLARPSSRSPRLRSASTCQHHLLAWFTQVAEHEIPELVRLARTIDAWPEELLAYFDTGGVANGPTEAINGLIKKVKRVGHGFRNFAHYRLRLLLHCGVDWQTPAVTPIRGRLPRLAA